MKSLSLLQKKVLSGLEILTSWANAGEFGELLPLSGGEPVETGIGESEALAGPLTNVRSVYAELQSLVAISHDLPNFRATSEYKDGALSYIH